MKKRILHFFIFIFMIFSLASCSSSIDEDIILIDSITAESMTDGKTKVTIKYQNEGKDEDVFYIPKGVDGTGISDFVYNVNKEDNTTDITFSFTDTFDDYTVKVPNGRGIKNILYTLDDDGNTVMTLVYTDDTNSEPIKVQRGEMGTSVTGFETFTNEDGSVEVIIKYSDGSEYNVTTIPAPEKGEAGLGIKGIVSATTPEGNYSLIITYTDDSTSDPITFDRPNTILHGINPPSYRIGLNGDLYFDESSKAFYYKSNDAWTLIYRFDTTIHRCSVKFIVDANTTLNGPQEVQIIQSTSFSTSGYTLPIPVKEGFVFEGWYLVNNPDVRINGKFFDTTIVYEDIKLYPYFVAE